MIARLMCTVGLLAVCLGTGLLAADGELAGLVTAGPEHVPVGGVEVVLTSTTREQRATTDGRGRFSFPAVLPDESHTLRVTAEGLKPFLERNLKVRQSERRAIEVQLELADAHYSVRVDGSVERRETTAEVSQRIQATQLNDLPTVTRSVTKFALLDPHVRQAIGLGADFQDATRLSINASSYRHTGYMLDGLSAYDWIYGNAPQATVSPGAVQEIKVLTGQYPAQFGLSTTGTVAITTTAGGERYHGEQFVFARPSGLQARPPAAAFDVPNERVDAGVSLGGPLRGGRSYFFANYEGVRQSRGAFIQSPQPRFFDGESHEQQGMLRVDYRGATRHTLTFRANASESAANNANDRVAGFNQPGFGRRSHAQSAGGQITSRALFGRAVNEVRLGFVSYVPDSATPLQPSVQTVRPNYATDGYSTTNWVHARTWQLGQQLTVLAGRQTVTFGGELVHVGARDYSFTPLGTYTFAPGAPLPDEHPLTYTQTFGAADLAYQQTQGSAFVQDEIRLWPRVTLTAGLRYEAQTITDSRLNFAPRGHVAIDLGGDGRSVLRGGAGLFYDQYYMYLTRRYLTLGPQAPQSSYTWAWGDPAFPSFPDSFTTAPTGRTAPARDVMIPADRVLNPFSRQLSVAFDRQLSRRLSIQVGGLDSHTYRQMRVNDINHPTPFLRTAPNQVRTPQTANLSRPYTTYGGVAVRDIAVIENTAESRYQSIDLGVTAVASARTRLGVHYVRSWSTTYAMFYADANSGVPNDWYADLETGERGPSDFHQPHRLVADATLPLPLGLALSLVTTAASGLPVNPITGRDNNGDSYTVDRPVGLARNSFRGPAQFNLDVAFARGLRVAGRVQAQLRAEIFNATNHRNYIRLNNVYGEGPAPLPTFLSPIAGITNADPSRQLQFAVKLLF